MRPYVIGIAGGTASGKTTISERFSQHTGARLIGHDRYYHDVRDRHTFNFDHPDSLDTALLVTHLDALRDGQPAALPVYHFPTHTRLAEVEPMEPGPLLIVEGILVLSDPELRARLDLAVWVEAPPDIRLARRVRRDTATRGRTVESVLDQYLGTVRPMHEYFVAPSASFADVSLDGHGPIDAALARLESEVARRRVA